jgi:hypothetical protein
VLVTGPVEVETVDGTIVTSERPVALYCCYELHYRGFADPHARAAVRGDDARALADRFSGHVLGCWDRGVPGFVRREVIPGVPWIPGPPYPAPSRSGEGNGRPITVRRHAPMG